MNLRTQKYQRTNAKKSQRPISRSRERGGARCKTYRQTEIKWCFILCREIVLIFAAECIIMNIRTHRYGCTKATSALSCRTQLPQKAREWKEKETTYVRVYFSAAWLLPTRGNQHSSKDIFFFIVFRFSSIISWTIPTHLQIWNTKQCVRKNSYIFQSTSMSFIFFLKWFTRLSW